MQLNIDEIVEQLNPMKILRKNYNHILRKTFQIIFKQFDQNNWREMAVSSLN